MSPNTYNLAPSEIIFFHIIYYTTYYSIKKYSDDNKIDFAYSLEISNFGLPEPKRWCLDCVRPWPETTKPISMKLHTNLYFVYLGEKILKK